MTKSHIRPIAELKEVLLQELEIRLEGNRELLKATQQYFPNNKQDLETLEKYGEMLRNAISAVEGTR